MNVLKHKVLVVGGGAAGMMAAGIASRAGAQVVLFEKNERLGKKLAITGKGRCNVTNCCGAEEVLQNIPRNGKFLYSALHAFPPEQVMAFFESLGCALKVERGNRVFPVSDQSASVIAALQKFLREQRVEVRHARVLELITQAQDMVGVRTEEGICYGHRVILCTGGLSYPLTGATGDGYPMAEAVGHTVVPCRGSLVPLQEDGTWCSRMQGLALRNVSIQLLNAKGKAVYQDFGELLFTHFGLSGPTILSASAHMKPGERYIVSIDLKPALDAQRLDQRMLRDFAQFQNRNMENALQGLYPKTMIPVMLARAEIDPAQKANVLTKQQRLALLDLTKHFTVPIAGPRPVEEAIITAGGVSVKEVDPKTMESKRIRGLYFAGELLDLDAYTGGFNLQIAWSTAYAAGLAAGGTNKTDCEEQV